MDLWRWQMLFGIAVCLIIILVKLWKNYHKIPLLTWTYFMASGLFCLFYEYRPLGISTLQVDESAGKAVILMIIVPIVVLVLKKEFMKYAVSIFQFLALVNAGLVVMNGHGFMNAHSWDTAFIAMILPTMVFRITKSPITWLPTVFSLFAIGYTGGRTAMVVMSACAFAYFLQKKRVFVACIIGSFVLLIGAQFSNESKMFDSPRLNVWPYFMNIYWKYFDPWIGSGIGTFQWIGPLAQQKEQVFLKNGLHLWMHNDYLQVLFETGIIGLTLMMATVFDCLKRSWKNRELFVTVIATLATMLTYYPFHWFITQVWACLLIRCCYEKPLNFGK